MQRTLEARCRTTAMGIMPHTDIEDALRIALTLDIPYWPQLPKINFYQDMFAQTSQNFPGIAVDVENRRLSFSTARFQLELPDYFRKMEQAETFDLSQGYSDVYERFLHSKLQDYYAIRGQIAGPISLGFSVLDEDQKPIIYNDEVKALLFDFIQRKLNTQYYKLRERNQNAFVWVDEPGLNFVFSGMYGYTDYQAKDDYLRFWQGIEGPRGLHLCPNVNLPFLLQLGANILSFDAYQLEFMPEEYARAAAEFIRKGGIVSWGIVPTAIRVLERETPETLVKRLTSYWNAISRISHLPQKQIAEQALLAPAKCSIKEMEQSGNNGNTLLKEPNTQQPSIEVKTVNQAFSYLTEISRILKDIYGISS